MGIAVPWGERETKETLRAVTVGGVLRKEEEQVMTEVMEAVGRDE